MNESRRVFVYVKNGGMTINDTTVTSGDQAQIDLEAALQFRAR